MSDWYKLVGRKAVPCDLVEGAAAFEDAQARTVAKTDLGEAQVSTMFIVLDHQYGSGGPPLVFETMIFGGTLDQYQERYSTWEEAERGTGRRWGWRRRRRWCWSDRLLRHRGGEDR